MARFILALFGAATLLGSTAHASEENSDAVFGLAQGCYAVQSLHNDRFMRRYKTNGTINNGWSFDFRAENAGQAASFYFKPSGFGT
ncbi:hypothetical protein FE848_03390 [Marinobacter sp. 1-3A]|nr:hypothetical protein [Marinobacter sp. 1-3A]MBK1872253.1 hypothetical protein [Marinobacter sp. 1-3A]